MNTYSLVMFVVAMVVLTTCDRRHDMTIASRQSPEKIRVAQQYVPMNKALNGMEMQSMKKQGAVWFELVSKPVDLTPPGKQQFKQNIL